VNETPEQEGARKPAEHKEKSVLYVVDEFTFRLNEGDVKRHTLERLASLVEAVAGKRITYAEVIA
jgi:hypothetical protein